MVGLLFRFLDLFAPTPDYFLMGNYIYATLQDSDYKITFPFTGQIYFHYNVYHADTDNILTTDEAHLVLNQYSGKLDAVSHKLHRFSN